MDNIRVCAREIVEKKIISIWLLGGRKKYFFSRLSIPS